MEIEIIKEWDWIDEGNECKVYRLQKGGLQADWIDKNNEALRKEKFEAGIQDAEYKLAKKQIKALEGLLL